MSILDQVKSLVKEKKFVYKGNYDLTGKVFGRLVVTGFAGRQPVGCKGQFSTTWHCRCQCGTSTSVAGASLNAGLTQSCGCIQKEISDDLTGKRFGRLLVESFSHRPLRKENFWHCLCDCGKRIITRSSSLKTGVTKSCSCLQKEIAKSLVSTHGLSETSEYRCWIHIKDRCLNKNDRNYKYYGGRGIKVCERWLESFENFYEDIGPRPNKEMSLDRIDNNGNYCPENCRWATSKQQARNTRRNRFYLYKGKKLCLKDWAETLKISAHVLSYKLANGALFSDIVSEFSVEV